MQRIVLNQVLLRLKDDHAIGIVVDFIIREPVVVAPAIKHDPMFDIAIDFVIMDVIGRATAR